MANPVDRPIWPVTTTLSRPSAGLADRWGFPILADRWGFPILADRWGFPILADR